MARPRNPRPGEEGYEEFQKRSLFSRIPKLIRKKGRAKGFESLRDLILKEHRVIGPPLQAIQLALQVDKHALFSEVATAKMESSFDVEKWSTWQDFLHGKRETLPIALTGEPEEFVDDRIKDPAINAEERPDFDAIVGAYKEKLAETAEEEENVKEEN
jgi:hypothetical protein